MTADSGHAGFGPEAYTQGDQFQRERRNLFGRNWLVFCASGQVAQPGEYVNQTIGGWPIFTQRGSDGMLRAFHNICRHQGMPIVEKPAGQCDQLRCRYHGWTYDLTGALALAPPQVAPADPKVQNLNPVSVAESGGLVLVAVKPSAPAPAVEALAGSAFAAASSTDAACNWKSLIEAQLADDAWRFVWPNHFQRSLELGVVVRQILPRSFSRTRFVDLLFVPAGGTAPPAEALKALAADARIQAEALQASRTAGDLEPSSPAVADFRSRVAAAL